MVDLAEMREKLKSSNGGNWINVRKFSDKVAYRIRPSVCLRRLSILDRHIAKYQDFVADLGERKSALQKTKMRAHTMNGIKFLESLFRRKNDVINNDK